MSDLRKAILAKKQEHLRAAEKLERDLKAIEELTRMAAGYGFELVQAARPKLPILPKPKPKAAAANGHVPPDESKTAKIQRFSAAHLRAHRKRATSGELAKVVMSHGITMGTKPSKYLSAVLSKSPKFDNSPSAGGYGLAEWNQSQRDLEAAMNAPIPPVRHG